MITQKQVKIGVIGVTGRGKLAEHWHKPQGESVVVAGMDTNEDALIQFKKSIGSDVFVTQDIKEFFKVKDMDAVVVTSPDWTHEEYVMEAFKSGKHVFCEKPMAITTQGCDKLLNAWQKSGKHFMIGFNMRYMNIFRVMKDIVDSGVLGEIKIVWVRHFVGRGGDWYYHDWHGNSKNTTSLLLQKASHDIDMIHWITGRYTKKVIASGSLDYYGGKKPNTLRCPNCFEKNNCIEFNYDETDINRVNKMDMCVFRQEIDVEDNSTVMMELEGGIKVTYMQCHWTPDYCRNYTFIGTEGRMENLDDSDKVIVKTRDRSKRWKNLADQVYSVKPAVGGHGGADPIICKDFVDMILTGKKPISTPLAGRMSVAVACAATESIRNGNRLIKIPDVSRNFKNKVF
ncbi:MAG: Gfo/Idh/MocA family oxidoreductase [Candidatus Firestonebacteria bacterium]